jgi:putative redox protein
MSVRVSGSYLGGLGVELLHHPSGNTMRTAAPVDNNGDGSSFSPTDMVAAGLGACMMTLIAIVGERDGIVLDGMKFSAEKHMEANPRHIHKVDLVIDMPAGLSPGQRKKLERAALTCPVKNSLAENMETPVEFRYPD